MKALQRITKNGNSATVSLPRRMLDHLRWRTGQSIVVELTECGTIEVRPPTLADLGTAGPPVVLDPSLPGVKA